MMGSVDVGTGEGNLSATSTPMRGLGSLQSIRQLEHIITEHVEIGVCPGQAAGQRGQYDDAGACFPCEQFRHPLTELDLGDDGFDPLLFYRRYQLPYVNRRRFAGRLRLNRCDNLEAKSSREIRPGRMMGHETPIGQFEQTVS